MPAAPGASGEMHLYVPPGEDRRLVQLFYDACADASPAPMSLSERRRATAPVTVCIARDEVACVQEFLTRLFHAILLYVDQDVMTCYVLGRGQDELRVILPDVITTPVVQHALRVQMTAEGYVYPALTSIERDWLVFGSTTDEWRLMDYCAVDVRGCAIQRLDPSGVPPCSLMADLSVRMRALEESRHTGLGVRVRREVRAVAVAVEPVPCTCGGMTEEQRQWHLDFGRLVRGHAELGLGRGQLEPGQPQPRAGKDGEGGGKRQQHTGVLRRYLQHVCAAERKEGAAGPITVPATELLDGFRQFSASSGDVPWSAGLFGRMLARLMRDCDGAVGKVRNHGRKKQSAYVMDPALMRTYFLGIE
jgi:hypothetical protein